MFKLAWKQKAYDARKHYIDSFKIASGCVDCKTWGPAEILSLDHVRGEKKFNIGSRWDVSMSSLQEELAKCDVVCHNCHAIRTCGRYDEKNGGAPRFIPFPKIPRLSRDCIISEKIDGTNGVVWVDGDGDVWAGSKNRWLTKDSDNHGFAAWVEAHEKDFQDCGQGVYHGEWWGSGIQRGYDLPKGERRFSLFNVMRWGEDRDLEKYPNPPPACCHVVPVLHRGKFSILDITVALQFLELNGSEAAPGYMNPEGVVIFHVAGNVLFKKTIVNDDKRKDE